MPESPQTTNGYLAIGRIIAPHGIRGEVKVEVLTDFPERFKPGAHVSRRGHRGSGGQAGQDRRRATA